MPGEHSQAARCGIPGRSVVSSSSSRLVAMELPARYRPGFSVGTSRVVERIDDPYAHIAAASESARTRRSRAVAPLMVVCRSKAFKRNIVLDHSR